MDTLYRGLVVQRGRLTTRVLVLRTLAHRRVLTAGILAVSALITATVVFAAGYERQSEQAINYTTFADGPGNVWFLTGPAGSDLASVLPAETADLMKPAVAGRVDEASWRSVTGALVRTSLSWRDGVCGHLVMVAGRCPARTGEVAVSTVDARSYEVGVGNRIQLRATIEREAPNLLVTGTYRVRDLRDPFWFDSLPTGRSGVSNVDEERLGDQLLVVREQFDPTSGYAETLGVAVDRERLRVGDVETLGTATAELELAAARLQARLVTGIPHSRATVAAERTRVVSGLALTMAQLGALFSVVILLLAAVSLSDHRAELGLARLRGESPGALRRLVVGRWAAVVAAGWLLGCLVGLSVLGVLTAILPGQHGLPFDVALAAAPVAVLVLMVLAVVPVAATTLGQPVMILLRAAAPTIHIQDQRRRVVDIAVVLLVAASLLVAVQSGATSVVGLLVPTLLALGLGVIVFRVVSWWAAARRTRLGRGPSRPGALLAMILVGRLAGLRTVVLVTCLATALAAFAVQVEAIGNLVRTRQAQVTTGAAAVLTVNGSPRAVAAAVTGLNAAPGAGGAAMTPVVITRRADAKALRGMFVEPATFTQVAFGADRAASRADWARISAPSVDPVTITGDVLSMTVEAHSDLGRSSAENPDTSVPSTTGTRADLAITYRRDDGLIRTDVLGRFGLAASGAVTLRSDLMCVDGCSVLRLSIVPNGPMAGVVRISDARVQGRSGTRPVDLRAADQWQTVPQVNKESRLRATAADAGGLTFQTASAGGEITVQHAWVPISMPVLLSRDVTLGGDPSVAAADGRPVSIAEVGLADDAVPRQLANVAVADLDTLIRSGQEDDSVEALVQVWLAPSQVPRINEISGELQEAGLAVTRVDTVTEALAGQRSTASALTGAISPAVGGLSMLMAALVIALAIASQRVVLRGDLQAIRLAGVSGSIVRRAILLAYLGPSLLGTAAGLVAGAVGCALVIDALPLLPDASSAIHLDLALQPLVLATTAVAALIVVTGAVLLSVGWLGNRTATERPRV